MAPVEPGRLDGGYEELRSEVNERGIQIERYEPTQVCASTPDNSNSPVRVGPGVRHGEVERRLVLEVEVLVRELLSVDAAPEIQLLGLGLLFLDLQLILIYIENAFINSPLAAPAVAIGKVPALQHEVGNHPMKN